MKEITIIISLILVLSSCMNKDDKKNNQPEKQISFALENKSHSYYVDQARLWWKEIERDSNSEENWYNYYRACRNAQGTADWRTDFVDESPYLRLGDTIVSLMEQNIPQSFTYKYVKGSTGAVDPSYGKYLLEAYAMNPNFPGIQAAMVTYAVSTYDLNLRKEVNEKWKSLNRMNPGLLQYSRNVLLSAEPDAILLTQHDNDSYPAWMLQDAYGLQEDVLILNIDFLLLDEYQKQIFPTLGIPPFSVGDVDINDYRKNWKNVVQHILGNYNGDRPLYIGLTVSPDWYKGFEDSLQLQGLTLKLKKGDTVQANKNISLYEKSWNLTDINKDYEGYSGNTNVRELNTNYLKPLKLIFDHYIKSSEPEKAETVRQTAVAIVERTKDEELIRKTDNLFKSRQQRTELKNK